MCNKSNSEVMFPCQKSMFEKISYYGRKDHEPDEKGLINTTETKVFSVRCPLINKEFKAKYPVKSGVSIQDMEETLKKDCVSSMCSNCNYCK